LVKNFIKVFREDAFYSPHFAITPLQKETLLQKAKSAFNDDWISYFTIASVIIPEQESGEAISVVICNEFAKDRTGDEERKNFPL
jgi:hypothetical protein